MSLAVPEAIEYIIGAGQQYTPRSLRWVHPGHVLGIRAFGSIAISMEHHQGADRPGLSGQVADLLLDEPDKKM